MTNGQKVLCLVAVSIPVIGYGYSKYAISNFNFQFTGISVTGVSIDGSAQVQVSFTLSSAAGIGFTINGLYLNLFANNVFVGTITQQQTINIAPSGQTPVTVEGNINLSNTIVDVVSFYEAFTSGTSTPINYTVQGVLPIQIDIPILDLFTINYPVTFSSAIAL